MRNPSRHRPLRTIAFGAALLFLAIGTLSGCMATPAPANTSSPTAVVTPAPTKAAPIFASNDEALAAATATYSAYLSAGDAAGKIGSDSWNEYLSFTTGAEHDGVVSSRKKTEEGGRSFTGTTSFDSMTVQMSSALPDETWEIRTYVCLDISESTMVDATGQSVSSPDRQVRWPMVIAFITPTSNSSQLLISESRAWSGSNFC